LRSQGGLYLNTLFEQFVQFEAGLSRVLVLHLQHAEFVVELQLVLVDVVEQRVRQEFLAHLTLDHGEARPLLQAEGKLHLQQDEGQFLAGFECALGFYLFVADQFPSGLRVAVGLAFVQSELLGGPSVLYFELDFAISFFHDCVQGVLLERAVGQSDSQFLGLSHHGCDRLLELASLLDQRVNLVRNVFMFLGLITQLDYIA